MTSFVLDETDQKILSYLIGNARMPVAEIARECEISGSAAYQRVKKMEESGVISGSHFIVNPKILGYNVCAFIGIQLCTAYKYEKAISRLMRIIEVVECHYVTGDFQILIKVFCRDNEHLRSVISTKLSEIFGVERIFIFMSLDEAFKRQVYVEDFHILKQVINTSNE
jgi:Lrp/AsnC family transcriptional regulator for asnA, asnC and gidA